MVASTPALPVLLTWLLNEDHGFDAQLHPIVGTLSPSMHESMYGSYARLDNDARYGGLYYELVTRRMRVALSVGLLVNRMLAAAPSKSSRAIRSSALRAPRTTDCRTPAAAPATRPYSEATPSTSPIRADASPSEEVASEAARV